MPRLKCVYETKSLNLTICSGIGKVEALVDHWKVWHDVALNRLHQGRPIVERRVLHFAARDAIAGGRPDPIKNFAAPALDASESIPIVGQGRHGRAIRTKLQVRSGFANEEKRM